MKTFSLLSVATQAVSSGLGSDLAFCWACSRFLQKGLNASVYKQSVVQFYTPNMVVSFTIDLVIMVSL